MTTRAHLQRQLALARRLQHLKQPCSFAMLQAYLLEQTAWRDVTSSYSKRTFERDVQAIAENLGIGIRYDARQRGYVLDESEALLPGQQRLLEAMELHAFLQLPAALAPYVQLEPRRPLGLELLRPLLGALQAQQLVEFSYGKFWEEQPTHRVIGPLLLKEFRGRWYMVGVKADTEELRCFGLDRMSDLSVSDRRCPLPVGFTAATYYEHAFGITRPDGGEPQDILLSLTPTQGRYVQSFPLHCSQQVLSQTATETRIGLRVFDTHDLRMELLSMGEEVKVLAPAELRAWLHHSYAAASSLY